MKWLVRITLALALLVGVAWIAGRWTVERQGSPIEAVAARPTTQVSADAWGVPTLRGSTWEELAEAQGYYVASQRMFHMDLMRRAASGRLATWFGARAVPLDKRRLEEDWPGVAARAYAELPADERAAVDAYAAGVNRFIREQKGHWSLEYLLIQREPVPWVGADSLSILLMMCEELSSSAPSEASEGRWRSALTEPEWAELLFTHDHPWNVPMFGGPPRRPHLPAHALPSTPLGPDEGLSGTELAEADVEDERLDPVDRAIVPMGLPRASGPLPASNSWAYCGEAGCFLANDPHLGYGVPQLWVGLVMQRVDALDAPPPPKGDEWVAGVAIPGLPGVVLGMNSHLAWAFTNTGEDVDDLLTETLSPDRTQYLVERSGEQEVWAPLITRTATIEVRDQRPVLVPLTFTRRGPLLTREGLIVDHTRQWLPLQKGMLRLPTGLVRARSWDELNAALDGMRAPAQNVLMLDRAGNIGYRTSGTGVVRRRPVGVPVPALEGEWLGFQEPGMRPRRLLAHTSSASPRFIATANQRIWLDDGAHKWADDARHDQIRAVLGASARLGRDDMIALQLDTTSRYHRLVLDWIRAHARPATPEADAMVRRWAAWDGRAASDPRTFSEALVVDRTLSSLLIARVRRHLLPLTSASLAYSHRLSRAWVIVTLEDEHGPQTFGLEAEALAARLLEVGLKVPAAPLYPAVNAWAAQHPFVATVPMIGGWFAVSTPPQVGYRALVRTEAPNFGASVRLVWKPSEPEASRWGFPVGQSGHIGSPHYDDARAGWYAGELRPVFP